MRIPIQYLTLVEASENWKNIPTQKKLSTADITCFFSSTILCLADIVVSTQIFVVVIQKFIDQVVGDTYPELVGKF